MYIQPDDDGKHHKKGDQDGLIPGAQAASGAEQVIWAFGDLKTAAEISPKPDYLGVAVCAENFTNNATVALRSGALSPDEAAKLLNLTILETGELAFVYARQIDPLLTEVSQAIKDKITNDSGYFVSFYTLESLARFVAEENGIGVSARLAAYEAIIIGSTRSIQVRRESSDSQRRESSEVIDQIARALQVQAREKPQLVTEIIRGIGNIPTHSFLAQSVSDLLKKLSTKENPGQVQIAALLAMGEQGKLSLGYPEIYAHNLVSTLSCFSRPEDISEVARSFASLLTSELTRFRSSVENFESSSFVREEVQRSWTRAVARERAHAASRLDASDPASKEALKSIDEAFSAARAMDRWVTAHLLMQLAAKALPESVANWSRNTLHRLLVKSGI
jgi:hypothetical protein